MHASKHNFRKSDKTKNIDIKRFLVKHSETAGERAIRMERKFQEQFIRQGYYEDEEPYKSSNWMREKNRGKWIEGNFRYGFRTENERINKTLDYNAYTYDYAGKDEKRLLKSELKKNMAKKR